MKTVFFCLLIFLSAFCTAQNITLPAPSGYVNDFENLFTPPQKDSLKTLLENYEKQTTNEVVVVTIPADMILNADINDYTLELLKAWGVGKKIKNNGMLVAICTSRKAIRIQNGYGIEKVLSDADTKKIIEENILPSFRLGKYFEGTYNGLLTIMKKIPAL